MAQTVPGAERKKRSIQEIRDSKTSGEKMVYMSVPDYTSAKWAEMAHVGCLIGYGPNRVALRKRMAAQIALIFRGTAAGDVPIELPTVFEFAVNQKIAKSLDLSVPAGVLLRADEVIE